MYAGPVGVRSVGNGLMLGRIVAAVAGLLFLVLAILLLVGFGGLGTYPLTLRMVLAGLLVVYGLWRVRRAWIDDGRER